MGQPKGCVPWNKGKRRPPFSDEWRKHMSAAHLGIKHNLETKKKMSENQKGNKNSCWRGGITPLSKLIRLSKKMEDWRLMVFGRDNFTCKMCGARNCWLEAHHIKPFAKFPELRFEVSNGITLCQKCHNKTKYKEGEFEPIFQTVVLNMK